jgi:hypothetical protein
MAKRVRAVYSWAGLPGQSALHRSGTISEARLWAWEYQRARQEWRFDSGDEHDTVALWQTRRPDLAPAELWVGEAAQPEPAPRT